MAMALVFARRWRVWPQPLHLSFPRAEHDEAGLGYAPPPATAVFERRGGERHRGRTPRFWEMIPGTLPRRSHEGKIENEATIAVGNCMWPRWLEPPYCYY